MPMDNNYLSEAVASQIDAIMSDYTQGNMTARDVQKQLAPLGYKARLRGNNSIVDLEPISGDGFLIPFQL